MKHQSSESNANLVEHLVSLGYTPTQISTAQENLWNSVGSGAGGFDDVAAVERMMVRMSPNGQSGEIDSESEYDSSDYETDEEDAGAEDGVDILKGGSGILDAPTTKDETTTQSHGQSDKFANEECTMSSFPLSTKLTHVARDFPNLTDAIFALNEWVAKAASRGDVERYLLEMKVTNNNHNGKEIFPGFDEGTAAVTITKPMNDSDNQVNPIGPLRTIIQRVLLFSNANEKIDPSTIIAGCANLITSILLGPACSINYSSAKSNNNIAHSTSIKKSLGEFMRRGRSCVAQLNLMETNEQQQTTPLEFVTAISSEILDLLQRAATLKQLREKDRSSVRSFYSASNNQVNIDFSNRQAEHLVKQLESEITDLSANRQRNHQVIPQQSRAMKTRRSSNNLSSTAGSVVVDIMSRRDHAKEIASKTGLVVEISVGCKKKPDDPIKAQEPIESSNKSHGTNPNPTGLYQSFEGKNALLEKVLGKSFQSLISSNVEEVRELEKKVGDITNETSSVQSNLTSRQSSINSKRKEISIRMDDIRHELDELQRQDVQLILEENEVSTLLRDSHKEVSSLQSTIEAKADHVSLDKELRRALEKMGELEIAWIRSSSLSSSVLSNVAGLSPAMNGCNATSDLDKQTEPPLLPVKLNTYLQQARVYFQSEAVCVEYFRDRISSAESDISEMEREIQVFSKLGMSTNVETIKNRLETLKKHVFDDHAVIDALRKDAKEMREDLIRRVNEYQKIVSENDDSTEPAENLTEKLNPTQVTALEEISINLTGIGFYDDEDGGLGVIFSKIPKRTLAAKTVSYTSPENYSDYVDCDLTLSYIGDIELPSDLLDGITENSKPQSPPLTLVEKTIMPKFSWANKAKAELKKETLSLLEIQREEMSAKEKN